MTNKRLRSTTYKELLHMSKSLEQVFHKIGQPMLNLISDQ